MIDERAIITDKAHELGRLIGQSDEYKALRRARETVEGARELGETLQRLEQVEETVQRNAFEGTDPPAEQIQEYEALLGDVQRDSRYQQLVAAQSNFDKLMLRVNERIAEGMRQGADSRIITLG